MGIYRTAQGKKIDMSVLARKNERTRAVGNMSVNARGDTIDSQGKIVVPVTKKVGDKYQRTVSNRAAALAPDNEVSENLVESALSMENEIEKEELLAEEQELDDLSEYEISIEEIKAQEIQKSKKK
jgi:hypothetical protein